MIDTYKKEVYENAINQLSTPLYLYDVAVVEREVRRFREELPQNVGLCFAMKANPFLTEQYAGLTDRIEVCSFGEFLICEKLEIPKEKLLISGVVKEEGDLPQVLSYCKDTSVYTVESLRQFQFFDQWSQKEGVDLHLFLRLTNGSQFGVNPQEIFEMLARIEENPRLHLEGIHYFTGTQKKKVSVLKKELQMLDGFFEEIRKRTGVEIPELEYGPGIGFAYFKDQEVPLYTDEGIRELGEAISSMKWKGKVTLEMGRALSAACGVYITRISDKKINEGTRYLMVDGGSHQLNYHGQIRGMYFPYIEVLFNDRAQETLRHQEINAKGDTPEEPWTICGSLCTTNDVLVQEYPMEEPGVGDYLVFENTGAYSVMEGMALFLSHELPAVAVIDTEKKNDLQVLRERKSTYFLNSR